MLNVVSVHRLVLALFVKQVSLVLIVNSVLLAIQVSIVLPVNMVIILLILDVVHALR